MTDRDLLELAAKAAGMRIIGLVDNMIAQPDNRAGGLIIRNDRGGDSSWNPITDDGDALRLAVKLDFHVGLQSVEVWRDGKEVLNIYEDAADPYAATRRAITRAAAEIGRAV